MKHQMSLGGLVGVVALSAGAFAGDVDPALDSVFGHRGPDAVVSSLVYLADRVDIAALDAQFKADRLPLAERHEIVVRALMDKAQTAQADLIEHLEVLHDAGRIEGYQPIWISNAIRVDAVQAELELIARRFDVDRVFFNHEIESITPVEPEAAPAGPQPVGAIEPGVVAVRAPEVWAMGVDGSGVLVSTLDTGVDGNHPALASRWRGLDPAYKGNPEWAWFDPVTNTTFPQSFGSSHGTHTMGTVCGGFPGDQVGVAPGAEWIHAAVIDRVSIAQTVADAQLAMQWTLDPDGNPGTFFDVPAACSNSWGVLDAHGYPACDATFWDEIDACEAAGIVMIFSAGNEGPGANTLRRPADRATDDYRNFAIAAVDGNSPAFPIASFSSRGPSNCGPEGQSATKPDIAAPGVSVRSSTPGGGYGPLSGTSMASPHICGVVAMMRQANPNLDVDEVKQIIYDTALELGAPGEDNDYGWGMVDAFEAVQSALASSNFSFTYPNGFPEFMDPNGGTTIAVNITPQAQTPVPGTEMIHYSTGGPFEQVPLAHLGGDEYLATFPSFPCGAVVSFYFSADSDGGGNVANPVSAPDTTYSLEAYSGTDFSFRDNFENDLGWTVVDDAGLTTGTWERGVPQGGGDRGDPALDEDGSGSCYVTGIADGDNDIDNGETQLTSPNMDGEHPDSVLTYARWYNNSFGGSPGEDVMVIEISDDGGASWVNLETIGPSSGDINGGWVRVEWLISDVPNITNSSTIRVRFSASDFGGGSVVEAGVDGVEIFRLFCAAAACLDITGDDVVDTQDFLDLLAAWGPNPGHPADFNGDNVVDTLDFLDLLAAWGPCS